LNDKYPAETAASSVEAMYLTSLLVNLDVLPKTDFFAVGIILFSDPQTIQKPHKENTEINGILLNLHITSLHAKIFKKREKLLVKKKTFEYYCR
jgi:hypothetical protein